MPGYFFGYPFEWTYTNPSFVGLPSLRSLICMSPASIAQSIFKACPRAPFGSTDGSQGLMVFSIKYTKQESLTSLFTGQYNSNNPILDILNLVGPGYSQEFEVLVNTIRLINPGILVKTAAKWGHYKRL